MPSSRDTNTRSEGLMRIQKEIGQLEVMPDADLGLVSNLRLLVVGYMRGPEDYAAALQTIGASAQPAPQQQPSGGGDPMMGPMMGAMGQVMGQPGGGGPMGATSPDELARMTG